MIQGQRCAVFSCLGLGDGLLTLILSHNLEKNGNQVTTFHPFLHALQDWFPSLPIRPFPPLSDLDSYDRFYIFYEKTERMLSVLDYCQKHHPEKTFVLNPIATCNRDYPYWEVGKFQGDRTFVDNLYSYCKTILQLPNPTRKNGITAPSGLLRRRHTKRVVLHPTSSRPGKNWPQHKFESLAALLRQTGFQPVFILGAEEREGWEAQEAPQFASLSAMAAYVYESGYMVGNDSGIGHLASCFGLPTVTICRSGHTALFWRPGWAPGEIVYPAPWIPNIKFLRLRDKYWKKWISVRRVFNTFKKLTKN